MARLCLATGSKSYQQDPHKYRQATDPSYLAAMADTSVSPSTSRHGLSKRYVNFSISITQRNRIQPAGKPPPPRGRELGKARPIRAAATHLRTANPTEPLTPTNQNYLTGGAASPQHKRGVAAATTGAAAGGASTLAGGPGRTTKPDKAACGEAVGTPLPAKIPLPKAAESSASRGPTAGATPGGTTGGNPPGGTTGGNPPGGTTGRNPPGGTTGGNPPGGTTGGNPPDGTTGTDGTAPATGPGRTAGTAAGTAPRPAICSMHVGPPVGIDSGAAAALGLNAKAAPHNPALTSIAVLNRSKTFNANSLIFPYLSLTPCILCVLFSYPIYLR